MQKPPPKKKSKKLDTHPKLLTKINSKWVRDLSAKCKNCKTIKLLGNNNGENLGDLWFGNDFLENNCKSMICERKF